MLTSSSKALESHSLCSVPNCKRLIVPRGKLTSARHWYLLFLAVFYLLVLPACSQCSFNRDITALSTDSMSAFLQSRPASPGLCSGAWSTIGVLLSVSQVVENVAWGFGHDLEGGEGGRGREGGQLRSETAAMIWFHKNSVTFSCGIVLPTIAEILPATKSVIQKILLLLPSRRTTSYGLRSRMELENAGFQIPL